MPEVIEFNRLSGDIDFTLKMMVRSVSDFGHIYQRLHQQSPSLRCLSQLRNGHLNSQGSYRWSGMVS